MDLVFTHWWPAKGEAAVTLWRNNHGKSFEQVELPETNWVRAFGVAAVKVVDEQGLYLLGHRCSISHGQEHNDAAVLGTYQFALSVQPLPGDQLCTPEKLPTHPP